MTIFVFVFFIFYYWPVKSSVSEGFLIELERVYDDAPEVLCVLANYVRIVQHTENPGKVKVSRGEVESE